MNILTFDIEEWFIYQQYPKGGKAYYLPIINDYLTRLLNLLDQNNQKATFFCLGKVAEEYPEVIQIIAERGHEIGCHSYKHILVHKMSAKEFYSDTQSAIHSIESVTGKKVKGYRAPAFSIGKNNKWAFEVLIDLGIEYDCSVFPAIRSFGGYPSFPSHFPSVIEINGKSIKEFPISFAEIFTHRIAYSGGGYFRILPYWWIKKQVENADYVMSYFHIRDFDAKQKIYKSLRYLQSYYGIKGAFLKISRYINDNKFVSVEMADKKINWESAPKVMM